MKQCAVIILNWNGLHFLQKYLPAVIELSPDCDVYVADNGSEDGSQDYVRSLGDGVGLLEFDRNYGFAGGYNLAISKVQNPYVCLLNSDVRVTHDWYKAPLQYLSENPDCVACQPKILSEADPESFEFAGACGGYIDALGYPFCRGRIMGTVEKDRGQYDSIQKVFWATGACFFVHREAYLAYGGLDEDFVAHQEEIDLCWRFNARGKYVAVVPQSQVFHVGGGTLSAENPRKTYLNFRNNCLLLYKNLFGVRYFFVAFLRFFLDLLSALVFVLQGKSADAKAVVRARRDFSKLKAAAAPKRKENKKKAVQSLKLNGVYHGSMVFAYYFLRKKYFSSYCMPNKS